MFRRRGQGEEPKNDLELTDEETDVAADDAVDHADARSEGGPWDAEASFPELERIDFGAVQVPIGPGLEVQVNVEATEADAEGNPIGGRLVAITVVHGESGLQLQAFAAPKRSGIWDEVRRETGAEITEAGGQAEDAEGPFGTELRAMVPVQIPDEVKDQVPDEIREQGFAWQPVRFLGVDGPRWFLRGVVSGAAVEDEEQWQVLEDVFRNVVVLRGDQPMPPRELLELTLPEEAQEALGRPDEDDDDDGFNPFERGPEITEVR
ncbi:DUF3710 domain-containing protein [Actinomadura sp. HBU206391]|uniref:DUF3710 domain-containing protein n=1 Tax=Actinomadura sp. HBU206391 TaxID=2731692 RepID=UPI001650389B|nr:DUF3710 domain-containing protein [Actinomadura sp. HBU206391]MBC6458807.1 DUF3710 domain-containing protein [Actinomadura sp. HBU206391]